MIYDAPVQFEKNDIQVENVVETCLPNSIHARLCLC